MRNEFDDILAAIEHDISGGKRVCGTRQICAREKLVLTLR